MPLDLKLIFWEEQSTEAVFAKLLIFFEKFNHATGKQEILPKRLSVTYNTKTRKTVTRFKHCSGDFFHIYKDEKNKISNWADKTPGVRLITLDTIKKDDIFHLEKLVINAKKKLHEVFLLEDVRDALDKKYTEYVNAEYNVVLIKSKEPQPKEKIVQKTKIERWIATCLDNAGYEENFEIGIDYLLCSQNKTRCAVEDMLGVVVKGVDKSRFEIKRM